MTEPSVLWPRSDVVDGRCPTSFSHVGAAQGAYLDGEPRTSGLVAYCAVQMGAGEAQQVAGCDDDPLLMRIDRVERLGMHLSRARRPLGAGVRDRSRPVRRSEREGAFVGDRVDRGPPVRLGGQARSPGVAVPARAACRELAA